MGSPHQSSRLSAADILEVLGEHGELALVGEPGVETVHRFGPLAWALVVLVAAAIIGVGIWAAAHDHAPANPSGEVQPPEPDQASP